MDKKETFTVIEKKRTELGLQKKSAGSKGGYYIENADYPHIHYDKGFSVFSCKSGDHDQLVQKTRKRQAYVDYIQDVINHCNDPKVAPKAQKFVPILE